MRHFFAVFFLIAFSFYFNQNCLAQDKQYIDSLISQIKISKHDTDKVNILLAIGEEYESYKPDTASILYLNAIEIARKTDIKRILANCLYHQGKLYLYFLAKYDIAESSLVGCNNIRKEVLGENHPDYASSLNQLAALYQTLGQYSKAEPLFSQALIIRKNIFGIKNSNYATSLNNLGNLYIDMGKYSLAEPLLLEAKSIYKLVYGDKHPFYAGLMNNLASLYEYMGQFDKAEQLYIESKNIRKETKGEKSSDYSESLNNLALLYYLKGDYAKAEPLYLESEKIEKELFGDRSLQYATSLNNLAVFYSKIGQFNKSEPLFIEALSIFKSILGIKHPNYALSINNFAELYKFMGRYAESERLYIESVNIRKEVLGIKHPFYSNSLQNLASLYTDLNENQKAEPLFLDALNIQYFNIQSNFTSLSELEKEKYLTTNALYFNNIYDFSFKYKKEKPEIVVSAYTLAITTKGLLLSGSKQIQQAVMQSNDSSLIKQFSVWCDNKELIGKLLQMSKARIKKMGYNLDSLVNISNELEKYLSQKSKVFASDRKLLQYTCKDIQQNLLKNEASIEFITYKTFPICPFDKNGKKIENADTTWYCALLLKADGKSPQMIRLCTKEQLEDVINNKPVYFSNAYSIVWKPIEKELTGIENIYLSPTGLLNRISYAMLKDEKEKSLIEKFNLYFVNNTKELATGKLKIVASGKQQNKTAAIFGGALFDFNMELAIMQKSKDTIRTENLKQAKKEDVAFNEGSWSYLSGTLIEANTIADLFEKNNWNTTEYTGYRASEENIKKSVGTQSPTVLHISTHGYFVSAPDTNVYNHSKNPFKLTNNSLMRSGLILAGGNRAWQGYPQIDGTEDGVLTSYEVSNMYLPNTELVVLSACETGLGDIKGGEGVYGLQRAFQVAGAKSVIMSLWQVPDDETMQLMSSFYSKWFATGDLHKSFREAQVEMSKKYEPFYWAAFVLVE